MPLSHQQSLSRLETEVCVVNLEYIKRNSLNSRYVDSELCSVQCESCFAVFYDHIDMSLRTRRFGHGTTTSDVSEPCVQLIKTSYGTQICPNIFQRNCSNNFFTFGHGQNSVRSFHLLNYTKQTIFPKHI